MVSQFIPVLLAQGHSQKRIAVSLKQFQVKLNEQEHRQLQEIVRSGKEKARKITRCRILLLADEAKGKADEEISDALNVCLATIFNIRRRYCQEGLERAITEGARSDRGGLRRGVRNDPDFFARGTGIARGADDAISINSQCLERSGLCKLL